MVLFYNKLWKMLIDKNINKGVLCNKGQVSKGTTAKMTNNGPVTLTVSEKLCNTLQCDIGNILQMVDVNKDRR